MRRREFILTAAGLVIPALRLPVRRQCPFILLLTPEKQPMSVTIYTFFGQYGQVVYGQLAAYSLLYSLPSVLLYLVLSRRLGGAFAFGGGVKG